MLTSKDLAKNLFDYFIENGFSERQIFLRNNTLEINIHGSLFVGFKLDKKTELSVLLESSFLDNGYWDFVSNGGVDEFYKFISNEARIERVQSRDFLKEISIDKCDGKYRYRAEINSEDAGRVFRTVFNECIRPAMYYLREHSDKI